MLLETDHDVLREGFSIYTRKAFQMLPELERPCILDVGCGSGVPTLELARLSGGEVVGIDIDQQALDRLARRIEETGLRDRVRAMKCSLFNMEFAEESFDIIWAEGSIHFIGFEKGLREWRRFIKPRGFLTVHDELGDVEEKLGLIPACGYTPVGHFSVPGQVWWVEYYRPLEKRIEELRQEVCHDPQALAVLEKEQREVDRFRENIESHGSAFFLMQKN